MNTLKDEFLKVMEDNYNPEHPLLSHNKSASELADINKEWTAWVMKHAYYNPITKVYQRIPTENYGTQKYIHDELFSYWLENIYKKLNL